jgi:hypothetical protein
MAGTDNRDTGSQYWDATEVAFQASRPGIARLLWPPAQGSHPGGEHRGDARPEPGCYWGTVWLTGVPTPRAMGSPGYS